MSANVSKIDVVLNAAEARQEAARVEQSMQGIAKSAQTAGVQASAGLSQVEAQIVRSSASTRQYTEAERQRTAALREAAIASGNASLAGAQRRAALVNEQIALKEAALAERGRTMSAAEFEASAQRVATADRARAAAAQQVTVSVLEAARAEQTLALANIEATETASLTTRQMTQVGGAIDRVAGVAVPGARSIGLIAGSFSAAIIPQLLFVTVTALVVGELIKLGHAKEEIIKLDDEQIAADIRLNQSMHTGNLFTRERATVLHDINALNAQLKQSMGSLRVAQGEEADAFRHSNQSMRDVASTTDSLQVKIAAYASALFSSTKTEAQATEARLEASKTINEQVQARVHLAAETGQTRNALVAELSAVINDTNALHGLIAALDAGALAQARFRAGQGVLGAARAKVAEEAAEAGVTLTHAEAVKRLNVELTRQGEETYKLAQVTLATEKNMHAFNETRRSGAGAARAHAQAVRDENIILQMQVELLHAQQRLGKENFNQEANLTVQEFKIKEQSFISKARLQKFSDDQIKQGIAIIRQLELAALDEISQKEAESIRKRTEEETRYFTHQRTERERMVKEYERNIREQEKLERDFTQTIQEEETKRAVIILKGAVEAARARNEARKFLFSQGQDASSGGVDRFLTQLKELGPAFQDVDKNAATTKTAIDYVRNAFDFSSHSAEVFQLKLDRLTHHSISFGQVFKAVFAEMFLNVQAATAFFEGFGQAISSVFEGLVTGTQNAKAAFLNFIATILAQMGSMAIAIGTIFLFIPGYGGLGAGLIAAGIAAMALSGVFRGLAQNAQKQSQQGAGASTGTAGGSAAPANGPAPPNVIQFPTSGPLSGGPVTNVFKLDYQGTKDFLAGRVVTQEALNNPNSPEVRKIKKHARAS